MSDELLTIEQMKQNRKNLLTNFLMERDMLTIQHRVFKRLANTERMKEIEASLLTVEIAIEEATKIRDEIMKAD